MLVWVLKWKVERALSSPIQTSFTIVSCFQNFPDIFPFKIPLCLTVILMFYSANIIESQNLVKYDQEFAWREVTWQKMKNALFITTTRTTPFMIMQLWVELKISTCLQPSHDESIRWNSSKTNHATYSAFRFIKGGGIKARKHFWLQFNLFLTQMTWFLIMWGLGKWDKKLLLAIIWPFSGPKLTIFWLEWNSARIMPFGDPVNLKILILSFWAHCYFWSLLL